jgi:3-oxoadipate enol-lactonase
MPVADIRGARLHYELAGDGAALVLVHEGVADSRMWDDQFEVFARRYRVLRYDVRGFGRSSLPGGPYSHVEDLRELLGVAGIDSAALVGASMGGRIALDYALMFPSRVRALVLVGPGLADHEWSAPVAAAGKAEDEALDRGDLDEAVEVNLRAWVDGPHRAPDEVDPAVRRRVGEMQLQAFRVQVPALEADPPPGPGDRLEPPASARLAEVRVPTLIVVGGVDQPDILEISERLGAGIPGAESVLIPDAAHVPNMERPAEFNAVVLDFLDRVDASERS